MSSDQLKRVISEHNQQRNAIQIQAKVPMISIINPLTNPHSACKTGTDGKRGKINLEA